MNISRAAFEAAYEEAPGAGRTASAEETLRDKGTGLLLISHDLAVVARIADRIAVMHDGRIVEHGAAADVLDAPEHPCTVRLLASAPAAPAAGSTARPVAPAGPPVLSAEGLRLRYPGSGSDAVHDVGFEVAPGEALGLVGESGAGKSTVARIVLGLQEPDAGTVRLAGRPWSPLPERDRRPRRRALAAVFQDPLSSFDPRYTVQRIIAEAMPAATRAQRRTRVGELLAEVGLDDGVPSRRPLELSGGQRQRVAIARALASAPELLVCDEPVSALDVSLQAQILDLLARIRAERGLAMLFVSHDLAVIRQVCDRVAVMKDGAVVESGRTADVFEAPDHPFTRELLTAAPRLQLRGSRTSKAPAAAAGPPGSGGPEG